MANINMVVPPGATSSYAAPIVDSHQNIGQRLQNPNTINRRIEEARLQDNLRRQLQEEFSRFDLNGDGIVTREELHQFFITQKGMDDEQRYQVVDEIFDQIDIDDNAQITMNEFVAAYLDTRNKLLERKEELMHLMVDHARQQEEVKLKLKEASQTERQYMTQMGIRSDSKLKVHIVDAQNLEAGEHQVKLYQDNSYAETNVRIGEAPIWNEAFVFDIKDPYQPVIIQLVNQREELILETTLDLNDEAIRDYSQQGEEIWAWAQFDERGNGIETLQKLKLRCHYSYSDVQRYNSLLNEWYQCISEDIQSYDELNKYLQSIMTPFGFLSTVVDQKQAELDAGDREDLKQQQKGDTPYHRQEKMYEEQLDQVAKNIAASMGYRQVPWLGVTYFCLIVQMILAMLTQMHRKDMVTMTVCALGFLFLADSANVRRQQFRWLVLLIFLSIGQDVCWFLLNRDVEDDDDDGGVERSVKTFSRKLSYLSFGWRILLALVLWKDSLDFISIVKAKHVESDSSSLEERVEQIMKEHYAEQNEDELNQFN